MHLLCGAHTWKENLKQSKRFRSMFSKFVWSLGILAMLIYWAWPPFPPCNADACKLLSATCIRLCMDLPIFQMPPQLVKNFVTTADLQQRKPWWYHILEPPLTSILSFLTQFVNGINFQRKLLNVKHLALLNLLCQNTMFKILFCTLHIIFGCIWVSFVLLCIPAYMQTLSLHNCGMC